MEKDPSNEAIEASVDAQQSGSDFDMEYRLIHSISGFFVGNEDWTPLIYSKKGEGTHAYHREVSGVEFAGECRERLIKMRMPIDGDTTYFCRAKVTSLEGDGKFSLGAWPINVQDNPVGFGTESRFAANEADVNGTVIIEGTISGYRVPPDVSQNHFHPDAAYFDVFLEANVGATSNFPRMVVEHMEIFRAPNTSYVGGGKVWTSANDGPDSGLDADTVDGSHGADLTPITHVGAGGSQHADAADDTSGFMSALDKTKLDGIEPGATADQTPVEIMMATVIAPLSASSLESAYPLGHSTFKINSAGWPEDQGLVDTIKSATGAIAQFFHGNQSGTSTAWVRRWEETNSNWSSWRKIHDPDPHAQNHWIGGTDELDPVNIGAANITHASRHAFGGPDALSPSSIHAVPADGTTPMTGELEVDIHNNSNTAGYFRMHDLDAGSHWNMGISNAGNFTIWEDTSTGLIMTLTPGKAATFFGSMSISSTLAVTGNATLSGRLIGLEFGPVSLAASATQTFTHGKGAAPYWASVQYSDDSGANWYQAVQGSTFTVAISANAITVTNHTATTVLLRAMVIG